MAKIYTWRTTKQARGYKFDVLEMKTRQTPNKMGQYADTKVIKTGLLSSRAKAKLMAQKWVRFFNSKKR